MSGLQHLLECSLHNPQLMCTVRIWNRKVFGKKGLLGICASVWERKKKKREKGIAVHAGCYRSHWLPEKCLGHFCLHSYVDWTQMLQNGFFSFRGNVHSAHGQELLPGCRERGTLLHCLWECKLVQPFWRTICRFLKKLKIELPYDLTIMVLGSYPKNTKILIQMDTCTPMFIVALSAIGKLWK